jgi:peptidoglycan/xylan/chitin deacetylase (PgdA/CDA1 family)
LFLSILVTVLPSTALASHQIMRWHDNHAAAVSVTFDDGLYSQTSVGVPLLNARGVRGSFFVLTGDGWNEWPGYWQSWQTAASQGHEIGSHTVTHAHLPAIGATELTQELSVSRATVDANISGQDCLTLAYPFGEHNDDVDTATAGYYIAARDVWSQGYLNLYPEDVVGNYTAVDFYGLGSFSYDYPALTTLDKLLGYLDDAELLGGWFMPHIHELETAESAALLEDFLDELLVRDVWVDTMGTVVRYMQERMASTIYVVGETPTSITLNLAAVLDDTIYDVPLTLRSTVPASWAGIQVSQGGSSQSVLPVVEGTETVVYYHAIPNGGTIVLAPATVTNQQPVVNAGTDQAIQWPASSVILDGTVTDDGLPVPPGKVTTSWKLVSGPGAVVFQNASSVDTGVTFPQPGTYVLSLAAGDGALSSSDSVAVEVKPSSAVTLEVAVNASSGDAEEMAAGTVVLNSSDLELVYDSYKSAGNQIVGLRFAGVSIPPGATITNAYVQFTVDETTSMPLTLTLKAQAADTAAVFTTAKKNVSSRAMTAAQVLWSPAPWTVVGQAGTAQRTPNIASLVQEVVGRPGWKSGNALAIVVTGSQQRIAAAYDLSKTQAPKLHVEYVTGAPVNQAPLVSAGPDKSILLPANTVTLGGAVADDGLPNPPAALTLTWSKTSGPGTVYFQDLHAASTQATFSAAGNYVLMLTAGDSLATASDEVAISVQGASTTVVEVAVAASAGDAEEAENGTVYLNSSDLELVYDSYNSAGNQTVGLRFAGVALPPGAAITKAYVQFKTDETTSAPASLVVRAERADNAVLFSSAASNISLRPRTTAFAAWSPSPWTVVGEAAGAQRTSDLSAVVQEVVNRPGWQNGNALVVIINGTGSRIALAYDGAPKDAPRLHVEYTLAAPGLGR